MQKTLSQKIAYLLLVAFVVLALPVSADTKEGKESYISYRSKLDNIKDQKQGVYQRVKQARQKERLALNRLQSTQRELSRYRNSYLGTKKQINSVEQQIVQHENDLVRLEKEAQAKAQSLKKHLHKLYIKRSSILSSFIYSLLNSNSITEFLNTLYYQKQIIQREMSLIQSVQKQQKELKETNLSLRSKKVILEKSKKRSQELQTLVSQRKSEQDKLVNKLRKERISYEQAERELEKEASNITNRILKLTEGGQLDLSDLVNNHYIFPCNARVTSNYGYRRHPIFRVRSFHSGIDLGARAGTPVKASNGGIVIYSGWYTGYGKTVIVSHGNNKSTLYAHLTATNVSRGEKVAQGGIVGKVGSTGYSTGPHLHFEYRQNGKHTNPMAVLR